MVNTRPDSLLDLLMPQDTITGLRKPLPERENSLTHKPNEIITEPNYKFQGPGKSNTLAVSKKCHATANNSFVGYFRM